MECLTGLICEVKPALFYNGTSCNNLYVNRTKATFLDCKTPFTTFEDYDYFICKGVDKSAVHCTICNSPNTMFNMTLKFLPFGNTAFLEDDNEESFLWTKLPKVFKSVSCTVGGFMDMFLDCSDATNVTSEFNTSITDDIPLWDDVRNASSTFRGAIGEYVQCTLQSVLNPEYSTGIPDVSDWGTRNHDWSFLFVLVFIMAGGVGNILVCLAVCLDRRLQNVTNYFLLSLAIADLLVSLFVMPLGAIPGFLVGKFCTVVSQTEREDYPEHRGLQHLLHYPSFMEMIGMKVYSKVL
ncbi:hypothetical protein L9F63_017591, partial [Diploptera punctata]